MDFNEAKRLAESAAIKAQAYAMEVSSRDDEINGYVPSAGYAAGLDVRAGVWANISQMWVRVAEVIDLADALRRSDLLEKELFAPIVPMAEIYKQTPEGAARETRDAG